MKEIVVYNKNITVLKYMQSNTTAHNKQKRPRHLRFTTLLITKRQFKSWCIKCSNVKTSLFGTLSHETVIC